MKLKLFHAALLTTTTLGFAGAAFAQQGQPAPESDADIKVEQQAPPTNEDLAARAAFLEAQIEALQEQINELKGQMTKATPTWSGAPRWDDKEAGFSFKPRGRIQFDTAFIEDPGNQATLDTKLSRNLGFNSRVRRIRLGAEGTLPGGFGYSFEMDYANGQVGFGDAIITYAAKNGLTFTIGNHETFESLEQITSSRFISFLERAQMNDAFGHTRRLGASLGWQNKINTLRINAGLFTAHSIDGSFDNDGWIAAGRVVYAPQMMGGQLHLGANAQYRNFQSNPVALASTSGAPSINQLARYRARPFLQTTDVRFVDTGNFAAESDTILGLELAGIFKAFHFAGEAQWAKVNAYSAGDIVNRPLDQFPAVIIGGVSVPNVGLVPTDEPTFFSWYAELGYFLTGETRGYRNGRWDRTTPLKPFSKGGWGAFQVNARYDYLDLSTGKLFGACNNNFTTGVCTASTSLTRGGKQQGLLASLIWIPESYVRFLLQFAHTRVAGGPQITNVVPDALSSEPRDERSFGVNSVASRIQIDF